VRDIKAHILPGRLKDAPWLNAPNTRAVMTALAAGGRPARIVGGAVRNALLDLPVSDIDLATAEPPDRVMALLNQAGIKTVPTGLSHGTITAVAGHQPFEVTTLRHDVETDGRRAVVAFTDDWARDATRRDFTINALYADADGTVHDYAGGIGDLDARRERFIGDPVQRIREDYLRILRFFRFHAWYGAGPADPEGLNAVAVESAGLASLSAERVRAELLKLLAAPSPAEALFWMAEKALLQRIIPVADGLRVAGPLMVMEHALKQPPDPLLRLMALTVPQDGAAQEIAAALRDRLRLSNIETKRIAALAELAGHGPFSPGPALRQALYRHGPQTVRDHHLLSCARLDAAGGAPSVAQMLETAAAISAWQRPVFPLGGADGLAAGLRGPEVGAALAAAEAWWIERDFEPGRAALLERLKVFSA